LAARTHAEVEKMKVQFGGKEEDLRRLQEEERMLKELREAEKKLKTTLPPEPKGSTAVRHC
jgi:hypothetical protein